MDRVCAARLSKRLERIPGKAGNMTEQIQGTFEPGERNAGGFLRDAKMNYRVRPNDVRVPLDLCRKLALRGGETLTGAARAQKKGARRNGKVLSDVKLINDLAIDDFRDRAPFDELTAINPTTAIRFETPGGPLPMRVIDLMTPIGLGQRGLIAAPPRTGKTMLLQQMAHGIATNHPDVYMMVLLIDERPEEVTEMRRTVHGEVIASSNDQDVASHVRIARLMIEKAKRHVECGEDVVILLDSLTRLGRAFNAFTRGRGAHYVGRFGRRRTGRTQGHLRRGPQRRTRRIADHHRQRVDRHGQPHGRGDLQRVQRDRQHGDHALPQPGEQAGLAGHRPE
jgi:transcription termination factor Rho